MIQKTVNFEKITTKDGIDWYQYPLYKQEDIKDLQEYKTMIMIGQTGSGKTTLINFFLNYYLGVKLTDNYRYILINEKNQRSQAHSQTQDVTIYYIKPFLLKPGLRIIDTPGFGDTRGIKQDKIIAEKINECFEKKVDTLTTICFLVQASCNRLTISQNYILSQILQMFGNDVIDNFIFMFTFCDGGKPKAIQALEFKGDAQDKGCDVADLIPKIPQPWFLKINSSAFANTDNKDELSEYYWNLGVKSFEQLMLKVNVTKEVSLKLTREVITDRRKLINTIYYLRISMETLLNLMDQYKQIHKGIQECDEQMSKGFKRKQQSRKIVQINLKQGEYVTNCVICNTTCHFPCQIPDDANKSSCTAITNDHCTICSKKCHWNVHKNMGFRHESQPYEEIVDDDQLKKKYFQSQSQKSQKQQILDGIENDYCNANVDVMNQQKELMNSINKLCKIALKPAVFKNEEEYLDLMIANEEQEKKEGGKDRIKTLKDMKEDWKLVREAQDNSGNIQITQAFYKNVIMRRKQKKSL